ncbi:MAG: hypothetical protein HC854_13375 [Flavobacterium sp.]|nr:hypothetical protein [Flavobacterium sp.]
MVLAIAMVLQDQVLVTLMVIMGDFKYLRKDKVLKFGNGTSLDIDANPELLDSERQNNWNDALFRFGWKSMLGWSYTIMVNSNF